MHTDRNRWRWFAGCLMIVVLAAGCYQQTGVAPEPLSPLQPGPTNTLPPTATDFPTQEPLPTSAGDVPTQDLFQPQDIPTTDPFGFVVPTTDPFGVVVPTIDPFAGGIAQAPTSDPFFQQQIPTDQPAIDPVFLTATAIINAATATEAFNMTATAQGFGIGVPTLTLTPTPTTFVIGQPQQPGTDCVHTVAAGENLFRIAMRYNVDLQTLASYNSITNPGVIMVGQQITVPGCGGTTGQPTTGVTPVVTGGTGCASPYTVQQGDTLFKISLRCGVPVMSIASANGISNINLIVINQQLTIPPA